MSQSYSKIETWTVDELVDATSPNPRGNRKVTIPEFQRRLTWPKKKQDGLIRSIKLGYPFGSLLMYRDMESSGEMEQYKLIDGLQRTQSLRLYTSHPNMTFTKSDISDELVEVVARELNHLADKDLFAKRNIDRIRNLLLTWLWDSHGFNEADGWGVRQLTEKLVRDVLEPNEESFEFYTANKRLLDNRNAYFRKIDAFLDSIRKQSDIGKAELPVIVFSGPSSVLSKVFKLLNTEGTPLDRYEVFAAQWLDRRNPIHNARIIDAIWKKYAELEKFDYTLDVSIAAPDQESRRKHKYTLFEYLFGLGQLLCQEFPRLFKPEKKVDKPSSYGFNLMAASLGLGVTVKEVETLPNAIGPLDIPSLEASLIEAIDFVNETLHPVLSMHPEGQDKTPYLHADNQIVSMIATAFQVRYNRDDLREKDDWVEKRDRLAKHLPAYFLFETLRADWSGSGDSRLYDIVQYHRYLEPPPSRSVWVNVLESWFDENMRTRKHKQKYIRHDYPEFLLLRYVFAPKLDRGAEYFVSHIVPTAQLQRLMRYAYGGEGPLNTIGNLALGTENVIETLGDQTFVEYLKERQRIGAIRGPGRYFDELKRYEQLLLCKADLLPSELTKEAFETFLRKRFDLLKNEFLTVWSDHIPADPLT